MDVEASNLPYELENTVFKTSSSVKVAGEEAIVEVELRTVDKNLRANMWFSDLKNKLLLNFSGE
jgi:hypothetical protein